MSDPTVPRPVLDIRYTLAPGGRVRLHVPLLGGSLEMARLLRARLEALPGAQTVLVNPFMARVTLVMRPAIDPATLARRLADALPELEVVMVPVARSSTPADTQDLGHVSPSARAIVGGFRGLSRRVARATSGDTDLRFLVPLGLLGIAARRALKAPAAGSPQWLTLAIFSYNVFRDLNHPRVPGPPADGPPGP